MNKNFLLVICFSLLSSLSFSSEEPKILYRFVGGSSHGKMIAYVEEKNDIEEEDKSEDESENNSDAEQSDPIFSRVVGGSSHSALNYKEKK